MSIEKYNTQQSQEADTHAPAGSRTRNPSKRAVTEATLDRVATGIGLLHSLRFQKLLYVRLNHAVLVVTASPTPASPKAATPTSPDKQHNTVNPR